MHPAKECHTVIGTAKERTGPSTSMYAITAQEKMTQNYNSVWHTVS